MLHRDEEHISDRLATFKKAAEELDAVSLGVAVTLCFGTNLLASTLVRKRTRADLSDGRFVYSLAIAEEENT